MSLAATPPNSISSDFITLSGTYFFLGGAQQLDFSGSRPFTIDAWVGYTALESAAPIFSRAGEIVLGFTSDGRVFARRRFWETPLISSTPLEPGKWHHVGVTCDGESWRLYVHGHPEAEMDLGAEAENQPQNIGTLKRTSTLTCEVWNLRIWDRACTDAQMYRAMDSLIVPRNGLVASFFPEVPMATQLRHGAEVAISAA